MDAHVTLEQLKAKVAVHIENAPAKPFCEPPANEIKVSHVQLIVGATITYLGITIGDDGHLVFPKRPRRKP